MPIRQTAAALFVVLATAVPATALAQSDADKATARALATEGLAALDRKDYAVAADRFARADALFHAPTLTLGHARALAGLGKLIQAQETYNRIIPEKLPAGATAAFQEAQEDAKRELAALEPRIPWLILNVQGSAYPAVQLDGQGFPNAALGVRRAVDPGRHVIRAHAIDAPAKEVTITLGEGKTETVTITLEPAPSAGAGAAAALPPPAAPPPTADQPPPPTEPDRPSQGGGGGWMKPVGFVALGLGIVGIGAGAVTGALALGKHGDLEDFCGSDGVCPSVSEDAISEYNTLGTISTIGFIVGGVGLVGGIVLLVAAPSSKEKARLEPGVTPWIGPGSVGAKGVF
jgi:hypothetical protein